VIGSVVKLFSRDRSNCVLFTALALVGTMTAAESADDLTCDPFQGHDPKTITRELITTVGISTEVPTTSEDFVTLFYEEAYQDGPSPATFGQYRHVEAFELNFNSGAPFVNGNALKPDYIPVSERETVRIFLSARGARLSAFDHLPARAGAAIGDETWPNEIEVIGKVGAFHDLTEITFPRRMAYNVEKNQVFVPSTTPDEIDFFLVCRRIEEFPNPTCSLFVDQDPFDLRLTFRRELVSDWRQIEQISRIFVQCIYKE